MHATLSSLHTHDTIGIYPSTSLSTPVHSTRIVDFGNNTRKEYIVTFMKGKHKQHCHRSHLNKTTCPLCQSGLRPRVSRTTTHINAIFGLIFGLMHRQHQQGSGDIRVSPACVGYQGNPVAASTVNGPLSLTSCRPALLLTRTVPAKASELIAMAPQRSCLRGTSTIYSLDMITLYADGGTPSGDAANSSA